MILTCHCLFFSWCNCIVWFNKKNTYILEMHKIFTDEISGIYFKIILKVESAKMKGISMKYNWP